MKIYLTVLSLILAGLLTFNAFGQTPHPKFEAFGGYTFDRVEGAKPSSGLAGSAAVNLTNSLGAVADYSVTFPGRSSVQTITGGPQVSYRNEAMTIFGRGLAGTTRLTGGDYFFTYGGGGGIDFRLNDTFSVRAIQLDYLVRRVGDRNLNGFRFATGLVFGK